MEEARQRLDRVGASVNRWLMRHSIAVLRISVGAVFLGFGVLKFFPGASPAQSLATETIELLTFGLVPPSVAIVLVGSLESAIGLCFLTGRGLRLGVWLLGVALIGVLSPLVLLSGKLFAGALMPTLEGQYVLKDVVLIGAGMVIAATSGGGRLVPAQRMHVRRPSQETVPYRPDRRR